MNNSPFTFHHLSIIIISCACLAACASSEHTRYFSDELSTEAVIYVTDAAVAWQVTNYENTGNKRSQPRTNDVNWADAIFLTAAYEWAGMREDTATLQWVNTLARKNDYRLPMGVHVYHADNLIVGMLYADMFEQTGDERLLQQPQERLEYIVRHPSQCDLFSDDNDHTYYYKQRWSWCDALFMAPQVFARYAALCDNPQLLHFMDKEYRATVDYLYSPEYKLFFRDSNYFNKHEPNGKPVFWGRGNGWVLAGLAKLIPLLPQDFDGRSDYIRLYRDMISTVVQLQSSDGHWYVSMLDPNAYPAPEMSSTAFFCYALWWGINSGIIDKNTYLTPATKAWQAIVRNVHKNGMLGSVQAVGEKPEAITTDMTEVYGPAAMVYAAQQILIYLENIR